MNSELKTFPLCLGMKMTDEEYAIFEKKEAKRKQKRLKRKQEQAELLERRNAAWKRQKEEEEARKKEEMKKEEIEMFEMRFREDQTEYKEYLEDIRLNDPFTCFFELMYWRECVRKLLEHQPNLQSYLDPEAHAY